MTRIFLIGYMGSGKTTLGQALCLDTDLTFIDLDTYIEGRYRCTINKLFAERGEEGFREIEQRMLHEVGEFENVIIATGGGTPCFFDNIDYMNSKGTTIFLDVPQETLFIRLAMARSNRPLLKEKNDEELKEFINEQMSKRKSFYNQATQIFVADKLEDKAQITDSVKRFCTKFNISFK